MALFRSFVRLVIFILFLLIIFILVYRFDNYMYPWQAKLFWGNSSFDVKLFNSSAVNDKKKYVADLISRKIFIGTSSVQIRNKLGPPTGDYYNYDHNLTYVVHSDRGTRWEIVFLVDSDTRLVKEILIHKQCCGVSYLLLNKLLLSFGRLFDL